MLSVYVWQLTSDVERVRVAVCLGFKRLGDVEALDVERRLRQRVLVDHLLLGALWRVALPLAPLHRVGEDLEVFGFERAAKLDCLARILDLLHRSRLHQNQRPHCNRSTQKLGKCVERHLAVGVTSHKPDALFF